MDSLVSNALCWRFPGRGSFRCRCFSKKVTSDPRPAGFSEVQSGQRYRPREGKGFADLVIKETKVSASVEQEGCGARG